MQKDPEISEFCILNSAFSQRRRMELAGVSALLRDERHANKPPASTAPTTTEASTNQRMSGSPSRTVIIAPMTNSRPAMSPATGMDERLISAFGFREVGASSLG